MSYRLEKIDSLIQQELSQIIAREIEVPEGSLATITGVETSADLGQAKIWLSVFPITEAIKVLHYFNKEVGHLQQLLNQRLKMRPLPRIKFFIDTPRSACGKN
jgi:ribosome-binding factor A